MDKLVMSFGIAIIGFILFVAAGVSGLAIIGHLIGN